MPRLLPLVALLVFAIAGCATTDQPAVDAQFVEGRELYLAGEYVRAFPLLHGAAREGNPDAQYALGHMYYLGQGVKQSTDRALEWIRAAAKQGNADAIEALSRLAVVANESPTED